MQFYYITRVGRLIEGPKRYALYLLFFIGLTGQTAFGQTEPSTTVTQLLAERSSRIAQSAPTRDIDLQLFELGHRPKAIVSTQTLENGSLRLTFPMYRHVPPSDASKIEARMSQNYTYATSITVNSELEEVTVNVSAEVSAEEIDALVRHFGYQGHE